MFFEFDHTTGYGGSRPNFHLQDFVDFIFEAYDHPGVSSDAMTIAAFVPMNIEQLFLLVR